MKTKNNKAYIVTRNGEFLYVKYKGKTPEIGTEFTGTLINSKYSFLNYRHAAAVLLMVLLSASGAYAYNIPVSTVTISSNPEVQLKSNIFNRVIEASSPDENTNKLINSMNLKNTNMDKAVTALTKQVKEKNKNDESVTKDLNDNKEKDSNLKNNTDNENKDSNIKDTNQNKINNTQKTKNENIDKENKSSGNRQNNSNKKDN